MTQFAMPAAQNNLEGITAGPDGNLWFTEEWRSQIRRLTSEGAITEFPLPGTQLSGKEPDGITLGRMVTCGLRSGEAIRLGA